MRARVLTALALIPPVLAALFCASPWPLLVLGLILAGIGTSEISRMLKGTLWLFLLSGLVAYLLPPLLGPSMVHDVSVPQLLTWLGVALFIMGIAGTRAGVVKPGSDLANLAPFWIAGPLLTVLALHRLPLTPDLWNFKTPVLLAIVPLWAGDTAAIFAGKAFGKHPLAPKISPKKTVEGGVANLIACVLAAWGLGAWIGVPLFQSLACGAAAGILGQAGDLFESWVKRKADLKDSGTLLPGHGGIMDRIDSILFTAPAVALILAFVG